MTTGRINQVACRECARSKDHAQTHKHQTHAHDAGSKTGFREEPSINHPRDEAKRRLAGGAFFLEARELNRTHEGMFTHDARGSSCEEHQAGRFPHDPSPDAQ
jgi:hypothetical protein